ncbi:MAG: rhodanese-like domain-containing protein, partial [Acidimicrobiales bacterium]
MPSFRDLLSQAKQSIREVDPQGAAGNRDRAVFVDVREADEYADGAIPEAVHIPRGYLELQIEG